MARYDDGGWPAYVPVAERRRQAGREAARLRKRGRVLSPVLVEGRAIAATVWGKAWCDNLERYRDYESRLPRGRTYVRNGSVIDLQVAPQEVKALVSGSEVYEVTVTVRPLPSAAWRAIRADCMGRIESVVELLRGRLSGGVMERLCRQDGGLFPKPSDIRFACTCLDHASMCKHVAAVLYGVGTRLDSGPELLFRLRAVAPEELLAGLDRALPAAASASPGQRVLADHDVSALFGIDMAELDGGGDGEGGGASVGRGDQPSGAGTEGVVATTINPPPQMQTTGRSRTMPRKVKPAPIAPAATSQGAPPDNPRPVARSSAGTDSSGRVAAAQDAEPSSRPTKAPKASSASGQAGRATRSRKEAKVTSAAKTAAAPLQRPGARSKADQARPASAGSGEPGADQALGAVLARLEEIGRGLGEVAQLRADVQRLSSRLDEIAAAVAGQGRGRTSPRRGS